ncbi:MAG: hypothetical protein AAF591_11430 [Verrucomicrobiota bacterium]
MAGMAGQMGRVARIRGVVCGVVWLGVATVMVMGGAVDGAVYEEPDFAKRLFVLDAITLEGEAREEVIEVLAGVVPGLLEGDAKDMDVAEKAMAIALRLDSMHLATRQLNDALIGEGAMPELELFMREEAAMKLWDAVTALMESPEREDKVLARYLMDVALGLSEKKAWREDMEEVLEKEGNSLEWAAVMTLESVPEPEPAVEPEPEPVPEPAPEEPKVVAVSESGEEEEMSEGMDGVLPPPSPEVVGEPKPEVTGPVASFRIPEAQVGVILSVTDDNGLGDPKFWMRNSVEPGELAAAIHVDGGPGLPGRGAGPGGMGRTIYSGAGIAEGTRKVLMGARDRFRGKHGAIPEGTRIELILRERGLEEPRQISLRSVEAPFYVLVDAMALGAELDEGFALGGEIDSEGKLLGTMRVAEVLEAASEGQIGSVVMSGEDEIHLEDVAIRGDVEALMRTQVFGIETIDEAGRYMMREREASVEEAMELFGEVRALLGGNWSVEALVRNPAVQERLEKVVLLCPDHLSAKVLLGYGRGELGAKCSLAGSMLAIESVAAGPLASLEGATGGAVTTTTTTSVGGPGGSEELFEFRNLRPKLHPEAMAYGDAVADVLEIATELLGFRNRNTTQAQQKAREMGEAGGRMVAAREELLTRIKEAHNG